MSRRLALLFAVLVALLVAAPAAHATVLAYLDGGQVWVASPDGSRKAQLSTGPNGWIAVTVADNGRILGVWNEPGKIFQLATMTLWDERGNVISQGPLPSDAAGWSSYAAPLSLDLTSDAVFVAYGYSGMVGIVPNATFPKGFNAVLSDTKVNLKPIDQSGFEYPTTVGRRVVAKSGKTVQVQKATSGNPFVASGDWEQLADISGVPGSPDLLRTDIPATGAYALVEMDFTGSADRIGALGVGSLAPPALNLTGTDCFLPSTGDATEASAAPDGSLVAWRDAGGVKVAGSPSGTADVCSLAAAPVVISPTGKGPSLGGGDMATLRPVAAPTPAPTAPVVAITLPPAKGAFTALGSKAGLPVSVTVPAAGKVTITATVPAARLGLKGKPVVVATGSARPGAAGKVKLRLKLNAKGKRYRKRLRGITVTLRITQNGVTVTRKLRLR